MCLPKEEGGLRVKNNHLFNVALLVKWKWRLFSKEKALWGMIIVSKYGLGHRGGRRELVSKPSSWWRDVEIACGS